MLLPPDGPSSESRGDLRAVRLAPPTAVARWPQRARGRARVPPQVDGLLQEERIQAVRRALLLLPERTALILAMRFGIGPEEDELTLAEIGDELALSRERIRQLVRDGLEELRDRLRRVA